MKKFFKSIWFPIVLFILLELIFFIIGSFNLSYAQCESCSSAYCPPCPSINVLAYVGIIPSLIISFIVYFLIKRKSKKTKP